MNLTFIQLSEFVSQWKKFRLSDEDLQSLEAMVMKSPESGDVVAGTGGVRKVRLAPPSRHSGKSGAYRVIYLYLRVGDRVVFLTLFAKKDQENLNAAQKAWLKKLADTLKS